MQKFGVGERRGPDGIRVTIHRHSTLLKMAKAASTPFNVEKVLNQLPTKITFVQLDLLNILDNADKHGKW